MIHTSQRQASTSRVNGAQAKSSPRHQISGTSLSFGQKDSSPNTSLLYAIRLVGPYATDVALKLKDDLYECGVERGCCTVVRMGNDCIQLNIYSMKILDASTKSAMFFVRPDNVFGDGTPASEVLRLSLIHI